MDSIHFPVLPGGKDAAPSDAQEARSPCTAPSSAGFRGTSQSLVQHCQAVPLGILVRGTLEWLLDETDLERLFQEQRLDAAGAAVTRDATSDLLLSNGQFSAAMVLSRCRQTPAGSFRWLIHIDHGVAPDITILVRMDATNTKPADYYLLPIMDIETPRLLLCESNGAYLDSMHVSWRPQQRCAFVCWRDAIKILKQEQGRRACRVRQAAKQPGEGLTKIARPMIQRRDGRYAELFMIPFQKSL